jgi:hypothetical protein
MWFSWGAVKAAQVKDAGRHVAVYRDAGDGLLDVEVGVEVGNAFPGRDEVVGSVTPAGDAAVVTHFDHTRDSARHTKRFGSGAQRRAALLLAPTGSSTATGWTNGTTTPQRSAPTSSTC